MIIKIKNTGKILEGVVFGENQKEGLFEFIEDLRLVRFVCDKKEADIYHSDAEVQKMIESALAEDRKLNSEHLEKLMVNGDKEITDLKRQIEELKAKVPQPVEISRELSHAIDYLKELRFEWWHSILLSPTKDNDYQFLDKKYAELLSSTSYSTRLAIIKNGYTIKPEPTLRQKIESILRALEYDFSGVEEAAKEIVIVLKHEGILKNEEA